MKMTKCQKQFRKVALANLLSRGGIVANDGANVTAIFLPSPKGNGNGHFSLSYAGNEKFSRKYGEMVALDRLNDGVCLPINENDFYDYCNFFALDIRENDPPKAEPRSAWPFPS